MRPPQSTSRRAAAAVVVVGVVPLGAGPVATAFGAACPGDHGRSQQRLFAVHWTHVPKAGGTAMARLARRVACAQNPGLEWHDETRGVRLNPCCVPKLCLSEVSCFASASTCPLVQGIGRHTSSMTLLVDMPCCSTEWFDQTRGSFLRSAIRAPPTDTQLREAGLARLISRAADDDEDNNSSVKRKPHRTNKGLLSRVRSLVAWPVEARVAFFAKVGVPVEEIERRADESGLLARSTLSRAALREIAANASLATRPRSGLARHVSAAAGRCHRASRRVNAAAYDEQRSTHEHPRAVAQNERKDGEDLCCDASSTRELLFRHHLTQIVCVAPGSHSMTLVRQPFVRLASAFFYRGHSPNSDNYNLRRGLWRPARAIPGTTPNAPRFSFRYFVEADEYRNVLTKMFGDSNGCGAARRCGGRASCAPLAECHAYRNASVYLGDSHLAAAAAMLKRHKFVGLLEAYNTSVKLAIHTFDLSPPPSRDTSSSSSRGNNNIEDLFQPSRASASLAQTCSGAAALRLDARACREVYALNRLDVELYEQVHRLFCDRLRTTGLWERDPDVRAEVRRARLCGTVDFSRADDVCGALESVGMMAKLEALRETCRGRARRAPGARPAPKRAWDWGWDDD